MSPETRVAELEAELAALRSEMQDFTYVVGHDLRAPLRHIVSFAQLVREDAGPQLSPDVQGFLNTITDSAQNLSQMLDALLALSRVGTLPLQPVSVPLQAMVEEVIHKLVAAQPERSIEWQISSDLPSLNADPTLLRTALQEVLSNAVKFTVHKSPAIIEVNALHHNGRLALQVRDNGVGFNPSAATKLMQPFQRLHSAKSFEGLGMGLAIARKCLHRLEGDMHIEARPDGGCQVMLEF